MEITRNSHMVARSSNTPEKRVLEAVIHLMHESDWVLPSYRMIAFRARVSARVVPDYIRKLEAQGLIDFSSTRAHAVRR
jgi:hypothetical protein